jgi:hypothetical protein
MLERKSNRPTDQHNKQRQPHTPHRHMCICTHRTCVHVSMHPHNAQTCTRALTCRAGYSVCEMTLGVKMMRASGTAQPGVRSGRGSSEMLLTQERLAPGGAPVVKRAHSSHELS